jgi:RND family efflux transporter MFP subunit
MLPFVAALSIIASLLNLPNVGPLAKPYAIGVVTAAPIYLFVLPRLESPFALFVVQVAPRISGPLVELPIEDNQDIKAGELLFKIDPRTFRAAVAQADARLAQARANLADVKDKAQRAKRIHATDPGAESEQLLVQREDAERRAAAELKGAEADLETAKLDLEFTEVHAAVDGYITHLTVDVGTQAVANRPILALVNRNSFWVSAFFRETLMENVKPGYRAMVRLMAYADDPIEAEVESVGWGIAMDDG